MKMKIPAGYTMYTWKSRKGFRGQLYPTYLKKTKTEWSCWKCSKNIPVGSYCFEREGHGNYCVECGVDRMKDNLRDFQVLEKFIVECLKEYENNKDEIQKVNALMKLRSTT